MNEPFTLLLRLEGPMQSWGYRSRFDYRDTALEPTRSGVIGLICAAMGIARGEPISQFDTIRMGVRVDKDGRPERDYHTALDVLKADGTKGGTVVSYRDYLSDASFTVGLQSEDKGLLDKISDKLRNPTWTLFLGRKAFPLAVPPLGPADRPEPGTLEDYLFSGSSKRRIVLETPDGERTQYDSPICFRRRQFKPRSLRSYFAEIGEAK
ncbi:MAG: type I-E CRISPR-associated protein Cas5/CasD [Desulfomonilaceae bacterium]